MKRWTLSENYRGVLLLRFGVYISDNGVSLLSTYRSPSQREP
jgi:hypothetical protein